MNVFTKGNKTGKVGPVDAMKADGRIRGIAAFVRNLRTRCR
jgi:hypothetical protein